MEELHTSLREGKPLSSVSLDTDTPLTSSSGEKIGLKRQVGAHTAGSRVRCLSKDRPGLGASPLGVAVTRWEGGARSWGKEVGSGQLGARWAEAAGRDTGARSFGPSLPPPFSSSSFQVLLLLLGAAPPPGRLPPSQLTPRSSLASPPLSPKVAAGRRRPPTFRLWGDREAMCAF